MSSNAAQFHARFQKVLEYIDDHLDEDLSVEVLSGVAAFSKYHFHRQFSELFGIGVYRYVQLCRLKRASYLLAFRDTHKVIDMALVSGYEGPESFSRAFKKSIGQSPSEFRRQPQWTPWYATFQPLSELRGTHMKPVNYNDEQIRIVDFNETTVAVLEHRGAPYFIGDSIRKFIDWRKRNHLSPTNNATYNILYNDPTQVAPEDFRLDICVATDRVLSGSDAGIVTKTIPAGRCAVLRHIGSDDTLDASVRYLYAEWLPKSGEEPRDFPVFLQRVRFFPDVHESKAVTDVFLPIY